MYYLRLFIVLIFPIFAFATSPIFFKDRLLQAKKGDYILTEHDQIYSLLCVSSIYEDKLILHEISIPQTKKPISIKKWAENNFANNTLWNVYEIDLKKSSLIEAYSYTRQNWLKTDHQDLFLINLLTLPLHPIEESQRRKIGPPPISGIDMRKIWNPPVYIEGIKKSLPLTPYSTYYPKDASLLSGKKIELYFDKNSPFPYWIDIKNSAASLSIKIIDSGKNLPINPQKVPKKSPRFISLPSKSKTGLILKIIIPSYHRTFKLVALDLSSKESISLNCQIKQHKDTSYTLEVLQKDLEDKLINNRPYLFLFIPQEYPEYFCETFKPFILSK